MFGMKKELQCIRREYQEKLRMIKEAHKTEHNAINAKHQEELESLDKKYNALEERLQALDSAHKAELEALEEAWQAEIKSLKEGHREKIRLLQEEKEAQLQALRKETSLFKETCEALQADNDRVYAGHRGLEEEIHFLKFRAQTLDELHESVVFGRWPHDGSFRDYTCRNPFENVEILPRGEVYTCCSAYLKHNYAIGNIFNEDFQEIWNSEKARRLRRSVQEGNFEFCQKYCKCLYDAAKNRKSIGIHQPVVLKKDAACLIQYEKTEEYAVHHTPKYITLSCDETCNLRCPTCRSGSKVLGTQESEQLYQRLRKVITPMLKECRMFTALASGEIFASSAVSRFLKTITAQEFPNLKLTIITNLQLADAKKWEEFSNLRYIPKTVKVSIDAACAATYEENRRGGEWKRLMENLAYLCGLRRDPDWNADAVWLNFVIQKNNYREMEAFVQMAEAMGADGVDFQRLTNWGTFCEEEYLDRDVFQKEHKEYAAASGILKRLLEQGSGKLEIVQNILSTVSESGM